MLLSATVTLAILCADRKPAAIPVLSTVTALLLSVTFIRLFQALERPKLALYAGLERLGRYALEIYLFQQYAIGVTRRLIVRLALPVNAAVIAVSTALEVAVPVRIGMLLKALHLHRFAFRPVSWCRERREK